MTHKSKKLIAHGPLKGLERLFLIFCSENSNLYPKIIYLMENSDSMLQHFKLNNTT